MLYANLAIRGRNTHQILEEQVEPAAAMKPDLVVLFSGTNDVIGSGFDAGLVARHLEQVHRMLTGDGATLLTFTLPDLTPILPLARPIAPRVRALNDALRSVSRTSGAILVDFAMHPVASDPRLWSADRLHANSAGHARMSMALAHALGLPGFDPGWADPLPPLPERSLVQRIAGEIDWGRRYFLPWVWRHARGRSSGDGRTPKRPALMEVTGLP